MREERVKRYEQYGISKNRFLQLKYLARQYDEMRAYEGRLRRDEIDRVQPVNAKWHAKDPTGNKAIRLATLSYADKIRAIEDSARAAAPGMERALLRCVTRGESWERIGPPCGRDQFYAMRRAFFVELDRRVD